MTNFWDWVDNIVYLLVGSVLFAVSFAAILACIAIVETI